jgi:chromosome segregation ATPase
MLDSINPDSDQIILSQIIKERDKMKAQSDKLFDAYMNEAINLQEYSERNHALRNVMSTIITKIAELETSIKSVDERKIAVDEIIEKLKNFNKIWDRLTFNERRIILSDLVIVKVFKDGHFDLQIKYSPS